MTVCFHRRYQPPDQSPVRRTTHHPPAHRARPRQRNDTPVRPQQRHARARTVETAMVSGRGGEVALALASAGVPFRIVPGVSAGFGGTACATPRERVTLTTLGAAAAVADAIPPGTTPTLIVVETPTDANKSAPAAGQRAVHR